MYTMSIDNFRRKRNRFPRSEEKATSKLRISAWINFQPKHSNYHQFDNVAELMNSRVNKKKRDREQKKTVHIASHCIVYYTKFSIHFWQWLKVDSHLFNVHIKMIHIHHDLTQPSINKTWTTTRRDFKRKNFCPDSILYMNAKLNKYIQF